MAALPAMTPIMLRRERRLGAMVCSVMASPVTLRCGLQRVVGFSVLEVPIAPVFGAGSCIESYTCREAIKAAHPDARNAEARK
jgi:hypothetical protein